MRTFVLALLGTAMGATAFAQLDSYTLTVTELRQLLSPATQATITVYLNTGLSTTLTDVLQIVKPKGFTQANFTSLQMFNTLPGETPYLRWNFQQTIPAANLTSYLLDFLDFQRTVEQNRIVTVDLMVGPLTSVTPACPTADMMADARVQAQALAQAAGFGLGEISTISDSTSSTRGVLLSLNSAGAFYTSVGTVGVSPVPTCALVVKFKLTLS